MRAFQPSYTCSTLRFILALIGLTLLSAAVFAQEDNEDDRPQQTLDTRVAQDLLSAYELLQEDDFTAALAELNQLMNRRGENMKPFDRATVLQIRGTAHVNLEDYDSALRDFSEAVSLRALPVEVENQLRFNMGQLNFVLERYEVAVELLEEWISESEAEISHTTYFMLAAAHYNLEQHRQALDPIVTAIRLSEEPQKRYYDLNNILFSQLSMAEEQADLLERMVAIWPKEVTYWRQLASNYLERGDNKKSFGVLESAYISDLIEEESDIVLLAQYYSQFDNPHRGAEVIEEEMANERVERTVDNLELLSQLWSQAREHRKAIPVLQEAASMSDTGMLSFRLGQAFLADEENEQAQIAFEEALEKGGLNETTRADAWLLLGNARFNQAGPGDRAQRMSADQAYTRAQEFRSTRGQATDWREYIAAINSTESRQALLEQEQAERMASAAEDRLITSCRAQQLAGQNLSEECERILTSDIEPNQAEQ